MVQNSITPKDPENLRRMVELVQILVPQKTSEPYRNISNLGILLDLKKVFGDGTKPVVIKK